jgi:hypothetical protein
VCAINITPHPEERSQSASRRTQDVDAAESVSTRFALISLRREGSSMDEAERKKTGAKISVLTNVEGQIRVLTIRLPQAADELKKQAKVEKDKDRLKLYAALSAAIKQFKADADLAFKELQGVAAEVTDAKLKAAANPAAIKAMFKSKMPASGGTAKASSSGAKFFTAFGSKSGRIGPPEFTGLAAARISYKAFADYLNDLKVAINSL